MKVKDLMTRQPACATPDMGLEMVAKLMEEHHVGSIPVVDSESSMRIVGVVTDRDITTRAVARGKNPIGLKAEDVMSAPVVTVREDDETQDVAQLMERNMIRRVPVVDERGKLCGIVAQADIALKTTDKTTADVVQSVSRPTEKSSQV